MALAQLAYAAEKAVGHGKNAITAQDVSEYSSLGVEETMLALVWMGKNKVEMSMDISPSLSL